MTCVDVMDIYQLKLVSQIAVHGSLTKAAIALNLEQSVLSRHLSALEMECGGRLFHRTGRGMTLTELGASVLPRIDGLLIHAEQVEAEIRSQAVVPSGEVRIGLLPAFSFPLVNQLFRETREKYSRIRLQFFEGSNGQLGEWITAGRIDIALVYRYDDIDGSVEKALGFCDACVISRAGDSAVGTPTVAFRDLAGLPLILPSKPNPLRMVLDQIAAKMQITLTIALEADSIPIQKNMVAEGVAYAILGAPAIGREAENGILRSSRIVDPNIRRNAALTMTTSRPPTLAMRTVASMVERFAKALFDITSDDSKSTL
jgi:LysR family transcriptional regulator, nitrogen assimilation regulatory protein